MKKEKRTYQKKELSYMLNVNNPLVFVKMRLGKSYVSLQWAKLVLEEGNMIIVAPYSALFGWIDELTNLGFTNFTLLTGTKCKKTQLFETFKNSSINNKVLLVNPEIHRVLPDVFKNYWEICIFDECTYFRNIQTGMYKYFQEHRSNLKYCVGLTGTPAPEGDYEYYPICKLIEPESFLEDNYYQFLRKNFVKLPNHKLITNANGYSYVCDRLKKFAFFLNWTDAGYKIKRYSIIRKVKLKPKTMKAYKKLKEEFALELDGIDIMTIFATTKYIWLRRLIGGLFENRIVDDSKVRELAYLVKTELWQESIIIWAKFTDEITYISDYLKKKGYLVGNIHGKITPKKREQIRKDFQEGKINILVAQPACFRFGADLSKADIMIYYSIPESGLTFQQSKQRNIQVNSNKQYFIIYLLCEKTLDETIYKSVIKKEGRSKLLYSVIKHIKETKDD